MPKDNIVDASKPSAGRMYDYYLGGSHNFEVDRQAAEQALKILPFGAKFVRLQRWALQDIAVELSVNRGYDVIIDFASGLPTMDHIHFKVKKGTSVIYSDYDPIVVEYTREILKDASDTFFFEGDARHPEEILRRPEVEKILAGRRKVGIVCWGISGFIKDEDISHMAEFFYDWSAPGSCWAFNCQAAGADPNDPAWQAVSKIYEQMGSPLYLRDLKRYEELLQPWKPDSNGFVSLLDWHGFDQTELSKEGSESFGPLGGGYGVYLVK
jgi:hypothetical protein